MDLDSFDDAKIFSDRLVHLKKLYPRATVKLQPSSSGKLGRFHAYVTGEPDTFTRRYFSRNHKEPSWTPATRRLKLGLL